MAVNSAFRQNFHFPSQFKPNWYPGHMRKSLKQLQSLLRISDCILEVHDARIPLSGRNLEFKRTLSGVRPHILLLNKADLSLHSHKERSFITSQLKALEPNLSDVIFTSCLNSSIKKVLPQCLEVIHNFPEYQNVKKPEKNVLVIGIPNVGKSSIINELRNTRLNFSGDATRVGALPGVTRALQTKIRVNQDPLTYLWDSPGILFPSMRDEHVALKLAVCKCIRDDLIGEEIVADYLLWQLNKQGQFKYVNVLGLKSPTDDINTLLIHIARKNNLAQRIKNIATNTMETRWDKHNASIQFLKLFRNGKLGRINLDCDRHASTPQKTVVSV